MLLLLAPAAHAQVEHDSAPKNALWLSPVTHLSLLLAGPMTERLHLAIPVGFGRRFSESTTGVLEVTPMMTANRCDFEPSRCSKLRQLKVTLGVAWKPSPRPRGQGFFLQPRLSGTWSRETLRYRPNGRNYSLQYEDEQGFQVTLGLDVGYRAVTRGQAFFFEPLVGLGVGYSFNQRRDTVDIGAQYAFIRNSHDVVARGDRAILDLDLDLVRIGFLF
ncbi:hypothetical protein [Myxococcus fulvus]|uniref:hypothetical protein n=1 Tax=Myxococcus fulvus TaxID=33 RepID=UPI0020C0342C|nr:hypothetical protein [Myxococcus fulvus]MCK8503151.1 hypothetical protein [Myxococcus fulvus]